MKILRIGGLSAILALTGLSVAKLALPNAALGRVEGALDFCAKVDPQSAAKYTDKKKALVQGASDQEIAEARASQEYKDGYEAGAGEMGKQPKEQVKKTCATALENRE